MPRGLPRGSLLPGISITADALNAEKIRMNLVAQNIANAFTTRGADGAVYQRKMVSFESFLERENGLSRDMPQVRSVRVGGIYNDESPGKEIYNPDHPHANDQGMVTLPNVEISREMVDLIMSSRTYEANLSVIRTARQLARQALAIGRR